MEVVHGIPTGGYPSTDAGEAILDLLKVEAKTWVVQGFPTTAPPPVLSPIAQEIIQLEEMTEGDEKKKKEDGIIEKIKEKLRLAQSIATRLGPQSYSVGVGFPFGVQVSFSWPTMKKS